MNHEISLKRNKVKRITSRGYFCIYRVNFKTFLFNSLYNIRDLNNNIIEPLIIVRVLKESEIYYFDIIICFQKR